METKRFLLPAVTTEAALEVCIRDQAFAFSIEEPLYSQMVGKMDRLEQLGIYQVQQYEEQHVFVLWQYSAEPCELVCPSLEL